VELPEPAAWVGRVQRVGPGRSAVGE